MSFTNEGHNQLLEDFRAATNANGAHLLLLESAPLTPAFTSANINTSVNSITSTAHGFSNGHAVLITTDGTLSSNLTAGRVYYTVNTTVNTFKISTQVGGAAVNFTNVGTGNYTATEVDLEQVVGGGLFEGVNTMPSASVHELAEYPGGVAIRPSITLPAVTIEDDAFVLSRAQAGNITIQVTLDNAGNANPIQFEGIGLVRNGSSTAKDTTGILIFVRKLATPILIAAGASRILEFELQAQDEYNAAALP